MIIWHTLYLCPVCCCSTATYKNIFCKNLLQEKPPTAKTSAKKQRVSFFFIILHSMIVIRNRYLPVPGFAAINLFGILLCRPNTRLTPRLLNHERIHTAQMIEMAFIFFYLWYVVEWLYRLTRPGNAYFNISFEREAYSHEHDRRYLTHRKHYAWIRKGMTPPPRKGKGWFRFPRKP